MSGEPRQKAFPRGTSRERRATAKGVPARRSYRAAVLAQPGMSAKMAGFCRRGTLERGKVPFPAFQGRDVLASTLHFIK